MKNTTTSSRARQSTATVVSPNDSSTNFYDAKKLCLEAALFLLVVVMFIVAAINLTYLPEQIPTHWGISGEPDNFGSKTTIFIFPILLLCLLILFFVLPLMDIMKYNIQEAYTYFYMFKAIFSLFFFILFLVVLLAGLGRNVSVVSVLINMLAIFFILLGFVLSKFKRNWTIGIRTPWTLNNDVVWEKTHYAGKFAFISIGLLTLCSFWLFSIEVTFFVFIGTIVVMILFLTIYSYVLYRKITSTQHRNQKIDTTKKNK